MYIWGVLGVQNTEKYGVKTPPGHTLQGRNLTYTLSVSKNSLFPFRIGKNLAFNRNVRSFT